MIKSNGDLRPELCHAAAGAGLGGGVRAAAGPQLAALQHRPVQLVQEDCTQVLTVSPSGQAVWLEPQSGLTAEMYSTAAAAGTYICRRGGGLGGQRGGERAATPPATPTPASSHWTSSAQRKSQQIFCHCNPICVHLSHSIVDLLCLVTGGDWGDRGEQGVVCTVGSCGFSLADPYSAHTNSGDRALERDWNASQFSISVLSPLRLSLEPGEESVGLQPR